MLSPLTGLHVATFGEYSFLLKDWVLEHRVVPVGTFMASLKGNFQNWHFYFASNGLSRPYWNISIVIKCPHFSGNFYSKDWV